MTPRTVRPSRRALGAGALGLTAALLPLGAMPALADPDASGPGASPARGLWAQRAEATFAAMTEHMWPDAQQPPLEEEGGAGDPAAFVWTLREVTAAAIDLDRLPPVGRRYEHQIQQALAALELYWDEDNGSYDSSPVPPLSAGGDAYFDDNAVIGLELLRRHRLHGDEAALEAARRIGDLLPRAWDMRQDVEVPGGMHWVDADWNPHRGAANVTALSAEFMAHLHEHTGQDEHLAFARDAYAWVRAALRRGPGLYANSIDLDETVDETLWDYNSGAMIGAAVLLARATGEDEYLQRAAEDVRGALDHWGRQEVLYEQPIIFTAILFANLLLHASADPTHLQEVLQVMEHLAQRVWEDNRDERGLVLVQSGGGGAPDPDAPAQTLHQAGAVQLFALLAWSAEDYPSVT